MVTLLAEQIVNERLCHASRVYQYPPTPPKKKFYCRSARISGPFFLEENRGISTDLRRKLMSDEFNTSKASDLQIRIYRTANISRSAGSFYSWSNKAFSRSMEPAKMAQGKP